MVSRYYAVKELLESGVNSLPVTTETLEAIINSKGFKIINYDVSCKKHSKILESLEVLPLADRTKAFTYSGRNEKCIFVKIGVSANEKRLLLAHELGHIVMRHISDNVVIGYKPGGLIDEGQEDEANAFALEILAPVCILSRRHINTPGKVSVVTLLDKKRSRLIADEVRNHKKLTKLENELCSQFETPAKFRRFCNHKITARIGIISFVSAVMLLLSYMVITHDDNAAINVPEHPAATAFFSAPEHYDYVVITKTGEKYHKPDCQYAENKTNTFKMTEQEALDAGYEPCAVCRPDK